jgi:hypothetical protein
MIPQKALPLKEKKEISWVLWFMPAILAPGVGRFIENCN